MQKASERPKCPNMLHAAKTKNYQLLGEVLDQGLRELGYHKEDLTVELFASYEQCILDLNCSKERNRFCKFHWPSFGMACGNPRFSNLRKVLTSVALERSRMVFCSPDLRVCGRNEYRRSLLKRLNVLYPAGGRRHLRTSMKEDAYRQARMGDHAKPYLSQRKLHPAL